MKIIKCIIFLFNFAAIYFIVTLILTDDVSSYSRIMMHELYQELRNTEILLSGASLCYRSCDPAAFESVLGKKTFNTGTSSQTYPARFYLMELLLKRENQIETVVLITGPNELFRKTEGDNNDIRIANYIVFDYMKWDASKVRFLCQEMEDKADAVLKGIRYHENWKKGGQLGFNIKKKIVDSDMYWSYAYSNALHSDEQYKGKGFVYTDQKRAADIKMESVPVLAAPGERL